MSANLEWKHSGISNQSRFEKLSKNKNQICACHFLFCIAEEKDQELHATEMATLQSNRLKIEMVVLCVQFWSESIQILTIQAVQKFAQKRISACHSLFWKTEENAQKPYLAEFDNSQSNWLMISDVWIMLTILEYKHVGVNNISSSKKNPQNLPCLPLPSLTDEKAPIP